MDTHRIHRRRTCSCRGKAERSLRSTQNPRAVGGCLNARTAPVHHNRRRGDALLSLCPTSLFPPADIEVVLVEERTMGSASNIVVNAIVSTTVNDVYERTQP